MNISTVRLALALFVIAATLWAVPSTSHAVGSVLTVVKAGPGSGKVTSTPPAIDCGANCNATFAVGTAVTLTATPDTGYQFTGWLGPCTGAATCSFMITAATTASATFAPASLGAPRIDVDDNSRCEAVTDGLLVIRYLFGLSGSSLVQGAVGQEAARLTEPQVTSYLNAIRPALDIDGNGATDALTDGLLIIRYLLGIRGPSLISSAIGPNATRASAVDIEARILELCQPPAPITAESCNGRDDNGDGQVDNGFGKFSAGIGACKATIAACTAGTLGTPVPGAPSAETCNGVDDNCNGAADEVGCNCVYVSPLGTDTNPGTTANPMRTIQAAINRAASVGPPQVCVATGITCFSAGNYDENVVMANGVAVYGGYQQSGATWPVTAGCVTRIRPSAAEGVVFPGTITQPTTLWNFTVNAANLGTTASAVTVDGGKNAVLSNLVISGPTAAQHAYGVNVINGAAATIALSTVLGGSGSVETIAVRAVNSQVSLTGNCDTTDASGRCTATPFGATLSRGIRSRSAGLSGPGESYGVLLDNSPNSIVAQSSVGGIGGDTVAALRIKGDGTGVRLNSSNFIAVNGGLDVHGIWAEDCAGAAPWIVNNANITTSIGLTASTRVSGVRAIGACNPVIDSNPRIIAGQEGATNGALFAIHCGLNAAQVGSQCVIDNNVLRGGVGSSAASTAILCEDGSCGRIERNIIAKDATTIDAVGIQLGRTSAFVEANDISAGCGTNSSTGIVANGSAARIVNNFIKGGMNCASPPALSRGILVVNAADPGEVDVHSNTIVGGGNSGAGCTSSALDLDASLSSPPTSGKGRFRNNIFYGGDCNTRYGVRELATAADPRIFSYNDIVPAGAATALYLNESTTPLTTAPQINALVDMTVSQTRAVDPLFISYPADLRLQLASPLRGAGTNVGAPTRDFFGQARNPATPSIGADEAP